MILIVMGTLCTAINDMDNIASTLQQTYYYQYRDICGCTLDDADHWLAVNTNCLSKVPLSLIVVMVVAPRSQKHFAAQQKLRIIE